MSTAVEAERLHARNATVALGVLLVASVLVLVLRWALLTSNVWAWIYVGMDLLAIGLVGFVFWRLSRMEGDVREPDAGRERGRAQRTGTAVRTGPYPAVRGVYTIAGLGVIGALLEFGDQLLG
jgi:protein-S-isoprenylcysteine O-methyltransferase Ste14